MYSSVVVGPEVLEEAAGVVGEGDEGVALLDVALPSSTIPMPKTNAAHWYKFILPPKEKATITEYMEGIEQQELEADLVLGGDEGKECTYFHGYMKRPAVFSCLTCAPSGDVGIFTACSLSCHDGHEVVELWTKRKFRCDCGNSKFGEFYCKLCPSKDPENVDNSYNQNFKGSYCTCSYPYPDPESDKQVEMMQCCM